MENQENLGLPVEALTRQELESPVLYLDDEDEDDLEDSELEDNGSKSRFRVAVDAIKKINGDFQDDEVLYDFIYKFRDVAGQSDPFFGSLLHVAMDISKSHSKSQAKITTPLIKSLLEDNPRLLGTVDRRGQTPLYMAICMGRYHLIEAMIDDHVKDPKWESSLRDGIEKQCNEDGSNCLHVVFKKDLRAKSIRKLLRLCSDATLAAKDRHGMTPLHHAIAYDQCTESRSELVDLFLARDEGIRSTSRARQSFLDLVDFHGRSVYRQHLLSRSTYISKHKAKVELKDFERLPQSEIAKSKTSPQTISLDVPDLGESSKANASDSEDLVSEDDKKLQLDSPSDLDTQSTQSPRPDPDESVDNFVGSSRQLRPQSTENQNRRRKKRASSRHERHDPEVLHQNSEAVLRKLKIHYMRTRDSEMVLPFLYGENENGERPLFVPSYVTS